MDLTDIYRTFNQKATEYALFSSAQSTFSRIDQRIFIRESSHFGETGLAASLKHWDTGLIPCLAQWVRGSGVAKA